MLEDDFIALVQEFGELQFKAGQKFSDIAGHVSMLSTLRDAIPPAARPSGPSPGPVAVETSKPRRPVPVGRSGRPPGPAMTTIKGDPTKTGYQNCLTMGTPSRYLMDWMLLQPGFRASREQAWTALAGEYNLSKGQFGNMVFNLRKYRLVVPPEASPTGVLVAHPDFVAKVRPGSPPPVTVIQGPAHEPEKL